MQEISSLQEGMRFNGILLCRQKTSLVTKTGKPYESILLQDRTGTLDGKIWDPTSGGIEDYDALDFIQVVGEVTLFQGALQLNIKRVRKARPGEYREEDYLPVTEGNIEEMYQEVLSICESVENPWLKPLLLSFFQNDSFKKMFCFHSAAKTVHHGFVGGLLEHTLSVAKNCIFFAERYPILNRDLLVTAALFHDVGKIKELSRFPENDYTDEGQLLGHIVIGAEMVSDGIRRIEGFPKKLKDELLHCILAHHGELEFGSPKKPALVEALALAFADNVDAKMEMMKELFAASRTQEGWLGYNKLLESNVRRTTGA